MGDGQSKNWQPKTNNISDDYKISSKVLGHGINGKVVEIVSKADNKIYALKVSLLVLIALMMFKIHSFDCCCVLDSLSLSNKS